MITTDLLHVGFVVAIQCTGSLILYLWLEKKVLTSQETNTVECEIISGGPAMISLWNNNKLLAQTNEEQTYLQHQVMTSQFGVFRCQAGNVSNSSLALEIGI